MCPVLCPWFGAWMQGQWGEVVLTLTHVGALQRTCVGLLQKTLQKTPLNRQGRAALWDRGTVGSTRGCSGLGGVITGAWPPGLRCFPHTGPGRGTEAAVLRLYRMMWIFQFVFKENKDVTLV